MKGKEGKDNRKRENEKRMKEEKERLSGNIKGRSLIDCYVNL